MTGYGIYSEGHLTVMGKLEVAGGDSYYGNGIYAPELVVDADAEVKASGCDAAVNIIGDKVEVNGKLIVDSEDIGLFMCIDSGGLITVNDGAELEATGRVKAGIASINDNGVIMIDEDAKVSAVGGKDGASLSERTDRSVHC